MSVYTHLCLVSCMLYVGLYLFCSPSQQNKVIITKYTCYVFCRLVIDLDAPFTRSILCWSDSHTIFLALIREDHPPCFTYHAPRSQRAPGRSRGGIRRFGMAVTVQSYITCNL